MEKEARMKNLRRRLKAAEDTLARLALSWCSKCQAYLAAHTSHLRFRVGDKVVYLSDSKQYKVESLLRYHGSCCYRIGNKNCFVDMVPDHMLRKPRKGDKN